MTPAFYFEADWDNNGVITTEQGTRLLAFNIRRGKSGNTTSTGYRAIDTGELNVTLKNHDGRFSLFNSSGSLYNYLRPNRDIRIEWYDSSMPGGRGSLFRGLLSNVVNMPDKKQARIEGKDGIEFLSKRKGDDLGLQTNYPVSSAITDILAAAGYPYSDGSEWIFPMTFPATLGGSAIENNGDVIPYFWGQTDKSAWQQILEIADAFAGNPYIAADGTFSYAARGASRASVVTLNDADVKAGSQPEQPWAEIRNYIKVGVKALTSSGAGAELWRMYDTPLLAPGETLTVWAEFVYGGDGGPATSVTTPVATTDYTANSQADGEGTDLTADLDITFTAYTTRAKLVLENTGASNLYVTLLQVRGEMLTAPNDSSQIAEDTDSQDDYEKRELKITTPFMQENAVAQYHAAYAKGLYAEPRKVLWVRIMNRPTIQLIPDLFDVVTLNLTELGATGDFWITYIEHDFRPKEHVTTWRLEPFDRSTWTFPATFPMRLGW